MTTVAFNHTQTSIEDVVSSGEYGQRMIRLANQFRREGNHDAANAALMGAAHARDQLSKTMDLLPIIAPEHAALLGETQRQHLLSQLGESHGSLSQLIAEHDVWKVPMEACDPRHEEWYASCLHIGHMAHLTRGVAARAAEVSPSEDMVKMTKYALDRLLIGAQESMADLRENDLPDDAPFPQTRTQLREQAVKDHAKIEEIHWRFNEVVKAAAEEDNSLGWCHSCGGEVRADDAAEHVHSCLINRAHSRYIVPDVDERYARSQPIMLWVRSEQRRHWMALIVQPTTSLRQIDQFLRDRWLECCGHMSHFEIGDVQYSACVLGPGDTPMFGADLAEPDEQHIIHTVGETVAPGQQFRHEFDYGDTTCLELQWITALPIPYGYLEEFINPPQESEGYSDDFITASPTTSHRNAVSPAARSPAGAITKIPTSTCRRKMEAPSWRRPTSALSVRLTTPPWPSCATHPGWASVATTTPKMNPKRRSLLTTTSARRRALPTGATTSRPPAKHRNGRNAFSMSPSPSTLG